MNLKYVKQKLNDNIDSNSKALSFKFLPQDSNRYHENKHNSYFNYKKGDESPNFGSTRIETQSRPSRMTPYNLVSFASKKPDFEKSRNMLPSTLATKNLSFNGKSNLRSRNGIIKSQTANPNPSPQKLKSKKLKTDKLGLKRKFKQ